MGYGVHECKTDGTKSVIVLFGETPCEYVHSHFKADGTCYSHSHVCLDSSCGSNCAKTGCTHSHLHNSKCCHTTVYVLSADQQFSNSQTTATEDLPSLLFPYFNDSLLYCLQSCSYVKVEQFLEKDEAVDYGPDNLSLFSQFRI